MSKKITIVIIAKNEAENLNNLLPLLSWAEILVIDNNSTDKTVELLKNFGVKFLETKKDNFAEIRNMALNEVQTDYIFYLDADERVTKELKNEVLALVDDKSLEVAELKRDNFFYGEKIYYGGWQNDYVTRIFRKDLLKGWQGEIHESPIYIGSIKVLKSPLWHLTHRKTADNLHKSSEWTIKEAKLLAEQEKNKVTAFLILRKMMMEFFRRYIRDKGYSDGMLGFVEVLVQSINRALVYIQVWELQQEPTIERKYEQWEEEVVRRQ